MSFLFPGWFEHQASKMSFDAAMRDLAQGRTPKARAIAAHVLGNVTEPTEKRRAVDALILALDDDGMEVRAEACASLGDLGDDSAIPHLVKKLDDGTAPVRQNAAIALGTLRHPDGFQPLADALADGPPDLRFQAATSLAEIDMSRAIDLLVNALGDRDPQVASAAALSLGASGDTRAKEPLVAALDHREAATRFDIAYALAELRDPAGRDILMAALADEDRAWDAATALGNLGSLDDVEALGRALINKRTPPEATILAAGTVLRLAPDSKHADGGRRVLLAALTLRKFHLRGLAVEQLGAVGGAWAKAPLEKLARTGKGTDLLEAIATSLRQIDERAKPAPADLA